jgi:RND family efflux transporter MFP subunit
VSGSLRRWLLPILAALALLLALVYASGIFVTQAPPEAPRAPVAPEARVMTVRPSTHGGTVTAFGQARARFEVTLAAQVSGQVTAVAVEADSGFQVDERRVLVEIEDLPYRMAVADAERALADAELRLQQERRQADRALKEWQVAELEEEPSALALREPQLAAAEAAIASAEASLANARNNLRLTRVTAPFPAVVVERLVGPGDVVQPGTPLVRIASLDRAEIRVPLSDRQWASIRAETGAAVTVIGPDAEEHWPGYVLRLEQHRGRATRQRALVIAVDAPLARERPLLPGTFVSVAVPTRKLTEAYRLPATALSADGLLWHAGGDGRLSTFRPERTIALDDEILAVPPEPLGEVSILVQPLASLTVGSRVRAVEINPALYGVLSP